eukprot:3344529-Ditylum_brightwellii.AAC.1
MPTTVWIYWIVCGVTSGNSSGGGTNWPSCPYQICTWRWGECSGKGRSTFILSNQQLRGSVAVCFHRPGVRAQG